MNRSNIFYKLAIQIFLLSLVISGFWLWEISFPAKLVGAGLVGMLLVITQEEWPYFTDKALERLSVMELRLRVIERSLELSRMEPVSNELASTAIAEDLEKESELQATVEKTFPAFAFDLLGMVVLLVGASGLSWLWVRFLAHRL